MNQNYANAVQELVADILKPVSRYRCPECGQTFTDPNDWAYGHDCESE